MPRAQRKLSLSRQSRSFEPGPTLRFTPTAWAKLMFMRDRGETEVGGFGVASVEDPLLIEDVALLRQFCTANTVRFDDTAVADYFDEQVDAGRKPEAFARVWIHTHPGNSAHPSSVDEETFGRSFEAANWAVMFILAEGGETYARLRFNVGPGGELLIPVEVDFTRRFAASDHAAWDQEYRNCVEPASPVTTDLAFVGELWEERDAFVDAWREYINQSNSTDLEEHEDDEL